MRSSRERVRVSSHPTLRDASRPPSFSADRRRRPPPPAHDPAANRAPPNMQREIPDGRVLELRFEATALANMDHLSLSDPFFVVQALHNGLGSEEIGRSETCLDDLNPRWTTTVTFTYVPRASRLENFLIVDIFDRDDPKGSAKLQRHDFLGRATFTVEDVLAAPAYRLDIPLVDSSEHKRGMFCGKPRGELSVCAEVLQNALVGTSSSPGAPGSRAVRSVSSFSSISGATVMFYVTSAALRKKNVASLGKHIVQWFELQRERAEANGGTSWSCVFRSEDGTVVEADGYVHFKPAILTERALHNMQPDRRLRLAFYKRNTRTKHELISYVSSSMEEVLEIGEAKGGEPTTLRMEGLYSDEEGLGSVQVRSSVRHASDQADASIHVFLRGDHFLHRNYISSLNDSSTRRRSLLKVPAFISLH